MTNPAIALAQFLLGAENAKLDNLKSELFKKESNLIDISDVFPFERKVYIASFDLDIYTMDVLDNTTSSVKDSIKNAEKQNNEYACFINGPFFSIDGKLNVTPIGKRKSRNKILNKLITEYFAVSEFIQLHYPACVYTDFNDQFFIESRMADETAFDMAKMFVESTPLFIDVENNINNFIGDLTSIISTLADEPAVEKGMPFIGISVIDDKKYLVMMISEDLFFKPKYDFNTLFGYFHQITSAINVTKMVFTDGSDSVLLKYGKDYQFKAGWPGKNRYMPHFIGIRRK